MLQAGHQERRRQQQQLGPGVGIVERHRHLLELEAAQPAHQPPPQTPGRVVLAGDGERGLGHRDDCLWCESCIDAGMASMRPNDLAVQLSFQRRINMLYAAYQTHTDIMVPVRSWALAGLSVLDPWANSAQLRPLRNLTAAYELIARAGLTHVRPPYGIDSVRVGNREVAVTEEADGRDAVRHPAAFQEGCRDRPASRSGRSAAVGPLCHPDAQPGAHPAAGARCLHHRLAQCPRCGHRLRAASASTTTSRTSSNGSRRWAPARTWWRYASPACR